MNYATVDDMAARFTERELIELTDTENIPPSTVDTPRVLVKLGDAQAFVDEHRRRAHENDPGYRREPFYGEIVRLAEVEEPRE